MTDIPSGAEDSALSGGDTDDGSGGDVDYSGRPSSAPPTLFGMSMKKVLSRPTDRVEQVIMNVKVVMVMVVMAARWGVFRLLCNLTPPSLMGSFVCVCCICVSRCRHAAMLYLKLSLNLTT